MSVPKDEIDEIFDTWHNEYLMSKRLRDETMSEKATARAKQALLALKAKWENAARLDEVRQLKSIAVAVGDKNSWIQAVPMITLDYRELELSKEQAGHSDELIADIIEGLANSPYYNAKL